MTEFDLAALEGRVAEWARARGILGESSQVVQQLRGIAECGELCETVAKGGDPIDDIGDIAVCAIVQCAMAGFSFVETDFVFDDFPGAPDGMTVAQRLALDISAHWSIWRGDVSRAWASELFGLLLHMGSLYGLSLGQCLDHAYNEIKDRRGRLVNGSFVKEDA